MRSVLPSAAGLVLLASLLWGCAHPRPIACAPGQSRATTVELVFGHNVGQPPGVSDDDWRKFIDQDVTPRFPEGFSVIDGQGRWRDADGVTIHGPSKVMLLALDGGPDDPAKIANIREAYRRRFHQDSVLVATHKACASF